MDRRFPVEKFEADLFSEFFGKEVNSLTATLFTGGACNSNYIVETSRKEKFVCRIHKRGNSKTEKKITERLKSIIPVPEYLWESEGYSVIEYIEGVHFAPTPNLVREAGRIIGQLSKIKYQHSGKITPTGEITHFEGWESCQTGMLSLLHYEAIRDHLSTEVISTIEKLLQQNLSILESFDRSHNLVHGDFRPDIILITEDKIVGVIDWEFTHSGSSYMDIGNLMRHIPESWGQQLAIGLKEEGFDLPEDWRFRALLIDLASHLEFLTSSRSDNFKKECVERIHHLIYPN